MDDSWLWYFVICVLCNLIPYCAYKYWHVWNVIEQCGDHYTGPRCVSSSPRHILGVCTVSNYQPSKGGCTNLTLFITWSKCERQLDKYLSVFIEKVEL